MNQFLNSEISDEHTAKTYHAFNAIYRIHKKSTVKKWMIGILIALVVIMFLPWTQNIKAKGTVTTLRPEQRPQQINNVIAGRVVKWFVKEGDNVKEGDTILQMGEVKVDYFDPQL